MADPHDEEPEENPEEQPATEETAPEEQSAPEPSQEQEAAPEQAPEQIPTPTAPSEEQPAIDLAAPQVAPEVQDALSQREQLANTPIEEPEITHQRWNDPALEEAQQEQDQAEAQREMAQQQKQQNQQVAGIDKYLKSQGVQFETLPDGTQNPAFHTDDEGNPTGPKFTPKVLDKAVWVPDANDAQNGGHWAQVARDDHGNIQQTDLLKDGILGRDYRRDPDNGEFYVDKSGGQRQWLGARDEEYLDQRNQAEFKSVAQAAINSQIYRASELEQVIKDRTAKIKESDTGVTGMTGQDQQNQLKSINSAISTDQQNVEAAKSSWLPSWMPGGQSSAEQAETQLARDKQTQQSNIQAIQWDKELQDAKQERGQIMQRVTQARTVISNKVVADKMIRYGMAAQGIDPNADDAAAQAQFSASYGPGGSDSRSMAQYPPDAFVTTPDGKGGVARTLRPEYFLDRLIAVASNLGKSNTDAYSIAANEAKAQGLVAPTFPQPLDSQQQAAEAEGSLRPIREAFQAGKISKEDALQQVKDVLTDAPQHTTMGDIGNIAYETAKGTIRTAAGVAGASLAAPVGATVGGTVGSAVPILGTVAGAFLGGAAAGMAGFTASDAGANKIISAGEQYLASKSKSFASFLKGVNDTPYAQFAGDVIPSAVLAVESGGGYLALAKAGGLKNVLQKAAAGEAGMVVGQQAVTAATDKRLLTGAELANAAQTGVMFGGGSASGTRGQYAEDRAVMDGSHPVVQTLQSLVNDPSVDSKVKAQAQKILGIMQQVASLRLAQSPDVQHAEAVNNLNATDSQPAGPAQLDAKMAATSQANLALNRMALSKPGQTMDAVRTLIDPRNEPFTRSILTPTTPDDPRTAVLVRIGQIARDNGAVSSQQVDTVRTNLAGIDAGSEQAATNHVIGASVVGDTLQRVLAGKGLTSNVSRLVNGQKVDANVANRAYLAALSKAGVIHIDPDMTTRLNLPYAFLLPRDMRERIARNPASYVYVPDDVSLSSVQDAIREGHAMAQGNEPAESTGVGLLQKPKPVSPAEASARAIQEENNRQNAELQSPAAALKLRAKLLAEQEAAEKAQAKAGKEGAGKPEDRVEPPTEGLPILGKSAEESAQTVENQLSREERLRQSPEGQEQLAQELRQQEANPPLEPPAPTAPEPPASDTVATGAAAPISPKSVSGTSEVSSVNTAQETPLEVIKRLRGEGLQKEAIEAHPDYLAAKSRVAAPKAKVDTAQSFLDGLAPMAAQRAKNALDNSVMNNGKPITRRELVESRVDAGAKIVQSKEGNRRLQNPDGSYLDEAQISKTAMDYAEHRISKQSSPADKGTAAPGPAIPGAAPVAKSATTEPIGKQSLQVEPVIPGIPATEQKIVPNEQQQEAITAGVGRRATLPKEQSDFVEKPQSESTQKPPGSKLAKFEVSYTKNGKPVTETIEAAGKKDLQEKLSKREITPEQVHRVEESPNGPETPEETQARLESEAAAHLEPVSHTFQSQSGNRYVKRAEHWFSVDKEGNEIAIGNDFKAAAAERGKKAVSGEEMPDGNRTFSQTGEAHTYGTKAEDAQKVVDKLTGRLLNKPDVRVLQGYDDLPENVRDAYRNKGVEGFCDPKTGKVTLIAEALKSPSDVARVFAHEVTGHYGVNSVLGEDFNKGMDRSAMESAGEVAKIAKERDLDIKNPEQRRRATAEYIAKLAEKNENFLPKTVNFIKDALQNKFLGVRFKDDFVRGLLKDSAQFLRGENNETTPDKRGIGGEIKPGGSQGGGIGGTDHSESKTGNLLPKDAQYAARKEISQAASVFKALGLRVRHISEEEALRSGFADGGRWARTTGEEAQFRPEFIRGNFTGTAIRRYVGEEIIHGAQLHVLRSDYVKAKGGGFSGSFDSYVMDRYRSIAKDLSESEIGRTAMENAYRLYTHDTSATPERIAAFLHDNPSGIFELGRQLIQLRAENRTTESSLAKPWATIAKWMRDSVDVLRGIAKDPKTASPLLDEQIQRVEGMLKGIPESDHFLQGDESSPEPHQEEPDRLFSKPSPDDTKETLLEKANVAFQEATAPIRGEASVRGKKDRIAVGFDASGTKANINGDQERTSVIADFGRQIPEDETSGQRKAREAAEGKDRQAASLVLESESRDVLKMDRAMIAEKAPAKLAKEFLPIYDHAIAHYDELAGKLENYKKIMGESFSKLKDARVSMNEVQKYVTHIAKAPENAKEVVTGPLFDMGSGSRGVSRYFTKNREFKTLTDAIVAGWKPKLDLADLTQHRIEAGERLLNHKALLNEIRKTVSPTDRKPIIAPMEVKKVWITDPDTGERRKRDQISVPDGYKIVQVSGEPIAVHDMFARTFKALYGESALRNSALGRGLIKAAALAKSYTLILDTFHAGRVSYKMFASGGGFPLTSKGWNIKNGLSLLEYKPEDLDREVKRGALTPEAADYAKKNGKLLTELMDAGINIGKVADNLVEQAHVHLPGVIGNFNDWLFQKLCRGGMAQSAINAFERNLKVPGISREAAARQTAKEMNEMFGNLQNQGVFKSKTMQDLSRTIFLAPQWAESQARNEGRSYAQLLKAPINAAKGNFVLGNSAKAWLVGSAAMMAASQVINFMTRGKPTWENEEGHKLDAFIPGGAHGFWFNPFEISGEYAHALMKYQGQGMSPVDAGSRIIGNKLSPIARGVTEAVSGRDYSGRHYLSNADRARGAITDALPFPIPASPLFEKDPRQPIGYRFSRTQGAGEKQVLQSAGVKTTPAQSSNSKVFAWAKPFRADRQGTDTAGEYTELRRALDNHDEDSAKNEIQWLLNQGKDFQRIKAAVGISKEGGIKPEVFAGSREREREMLRSFTPERLEVYRQAQQDHRNNALLLRRLLSQGGFSQPQKK